MKKNLIYSIIIAITILLFTVTFFVACSQPLPASQKYEDYVKEQVAINANGSHYDEQFTPTKEQAIILMPGVLSSSLYSPYDEQSSSTAYWNLEMSKDTVTLISSLGKMKSTVLPTLAADKDCNVATTLRPGNMTDPSPYDAFDSMKNVYTYCAENFSQNYDVICWQYDWRLHLDVAADNLESFINRCGYKQVALITHSMGGVVASRYLIKEQNRQKVKLFIPAGTPFLGALEANAILCPMKDKVKSPGLLGMFDMDEIGQLLNKELSIIGSARNLYSAYHLFALDKLFDAPIYGQDQTGLVLDNKSVKLNQFIEFLSDYDWAKGENGKLKFALESLDYFQSQYYIDGQHVSTLVNTQYIVGVDTKTVSKVCYDTKERVISSFESSTMGDGLVLQYSATAGLTWQGDDVPENVFIIHEANHMDVYSAENVKKVFDKINFE